MLVKNNLAKRTKFVLNNPNPQTFIPYFNLFKELSRHEFAVPVGAARDLFPNIIKQLNLPTRKTRKNSEYQNIPFELVQIEHKFVKS